MPIYFLFLDLSMIEAARQCRFDVLVGCAMHSTEADRVHLTDRVLDV